MLCYLYVMDCINKVAALRGIYVNYKKERQLLLGIADLSGLNLAQSNESSDDTTLRERTKDTKFQ
jgi:hypothetical protein